MTFEGRVPKHDVMAEQCRHDVMFLRIHTGACLSLTNHRINHHINILSSDSKMKSFVLFGFLSAGSVWLPQVCAGPVVLTNQNFGINDVFSASQREDGNVINLNTGQASAQCRGDDCTVTGGSSQAISRHAVQRAINSHVLSLGQRAAADVGAQSIFNFQRENTLFVKNGQQVAQCMGTGCESNIVSESTVGGKRSKLPRALKATSSESKATILFENISLGEGTS